MSEVLFRCEGVGRRYGETPVLHDCTFSLSAGSFTVLIGPSGCGKTTLLEIIAGLQPHEEGTLWLNGQRVDTQDAQKIAVVFQDRTRKHRLWRTGSPLWGHSGKGGGDRRSSLALSIAGTAL